MGHLRIVERDSMMEDTGVLMLEWGTTHRQIITVGTPVRVIVRRRDRGRVLMPMRTVWPSVDTTEPTPRQRPAVWGQATGQGIG